MVTEDKYLSRNGARKRKSRSRAPRKEQSRAKVFSKEPESLPKRSDWLKRLAPWILVILAGAPYLSSLSNGFVSDDQIVVVENPFVQDPTRLPELLGFTDGTPEARPLRTLTYLLDRALFGDDPFAFHRTNLLLHLIATLLVFGLGRRLKIGLLASFVGAGLFAVHPAHSEAVFFVTARKDLLAVIFILLAFLSFLTFQRKGTVWSCLMVVVCVVCAVLGKEVAVVAPILFLGYDFFSRGTEKRGIQRLGIVLRARPFFYGLFFAGAIAAGMLALFDHKISARVTPGGEGLYGDLTSHLSLCLAVWGKYLGLLFFPIQLSSDYSFGTFLIPDGISSPGAFVGAALLLGWILFAGFALRRGKLEGFLMAWVLIGLLPVLQIIPHHEILSEHNLYLPAVGFCLGVAMLLVRLGEKKPGVLLAWVSILLIVLGGKTWVRGGDWRDMERLTGSVLEVYPDCARALYNEASVALSRRRMDEAYAGFQKAVVSARKAPPGLDRTLGDSLNQLGLLDYSAYSGQGKQPGDPRLSRALLAFKEAVTLKGNRDLAPVLNLATCSLASGFIKEAQEALELPMKEVMGSFDGELSSKRERVVELYLYAGEHLPGDRRNDRLLEVRGAAALLSVSSKVDSREAMARLQEALLRANEVEAVYAFRATGWKGRDASSLRAKIRARHGREKGKGREAIKQSFTRVDCERGEWLGDFLTSEEATGKWLSHVSSHVLGSLKKQRSGALSVAREGFQKAMIELCGSRFSHEKPRLEPR